MIIYKQKGRLLLFLTRRYPLYELSRIYHHILFVKLTLDLSHFAKINKRHIITILEFSIKFLDMLIGAEIGYTIQCPNSHTYYLLIIYADLRTAEVSAPVAEVQAEAQVLGQTQSQIHQMDLPLHLLPTV